MRKIFSKAIVLVGEPRKGKSTTIKMSAGMVEKLVDPRIVTQGDIVVVVKRMIKRKKIKIKRTYVFITLGDTLRQLEEAVKEAIKLEKHIDVLVCASHPDNIKSGKDCLNYINKISRKVIMIKKTISLTKNGEQRANIKDANKIYGELDR